MLRRFVMATAGLAVAGCSSLPGSGTIGELNVFRGKADGPGRWASGDVPSAPPQGDWVSEFNDETLELLIAEAIQNNYDLAASAARFEQARAALRQTRAGLLPSLDARVDRSQNEFISNQELTDFNGDGVVDQNDVDVASNQGISTGISVIESNNAGLSLAATWEADVWGRLRASTKAAAQDAIAAEANLADARLSLAGSVARAWFDLIQARQLTALAEDEVQSQDRSLELTERRFNAGIAAPLDVRLARSALASSQASLIQQRNGERAAARTLEVLLGRYPQSEINGGASLPVLLELTGAGAPGDVLTRRPDVRAAEASLEAAGLRTEAARKALLPSLSLQASYGTDGDDFSEAFDPDFLVTQLAGSLLQPVFRGGALRADVDRNREIARERLATYAATTLAAFAEAENALDAETALAAQENALALAVREAEAAEELAEREYGRGVGTIFELLDAQRRRISAERALINVRRDRVVNRVNLYIAIGGDFDSVTALEPTPQPTQEGAL